MISQGLIVYIPYFQLSVTNAMPQIDPDSLPYAVLDLARLCRTAFEKHVADANVGVTPGEARVLAWVARHGPLRQACLAELTSLGPMAITGYLDRLEHAGLVRREPDPADRRAKLVSLTEASGPMLSSLQRIGDQLRQAIRTGMDDDEWAQLLDLIRRARRNLSEADGPSGRRQGAA